MRQILLFNSNKIVDDHNHKKNTDHFQLEAQTMWFIFLTILLYNGVVSTDFSPDTTDFDAYGLKIAGNDVLFVEADNKAQTYLVLFEPYKLHNGFTSMFN